MSNCVDGVFPGRFKGGRGWHRVVHMYMGLCPAEQAHAGVLCLIRKGI